ncbi:annulin-like [Anopheles nili]|uniref:annulin-like n=1 Tax=Anopheles nili TaxID=185578 RepID=UPI00237B057D|nr:annulin-like [Anopheles nili]
MPYKSQIRNYRIWPRRRVTTHPSIRDVLQIESVDLSFRENGKTFHTDLYELMARPRFANRPRQLVVRRGAPFVVRLLCNRSFDPSVDTLVLAFSVVPFGTEMICFGNGTEVYVRLQVKDTDGWEDLQDEWGAWLTNTTEKHGGEIELTLLIMTPSNAPVARWTMEFHCRLDTTNAKSYMKSPSLVYLLYNPWCKKDAVFLEVRVTRALGSALNSRDFYGVLEGNWTGNYEQGRPPLSWGGSVKILQQFYATLKPVKYGQCWVYAGIFGTVCRALGIPIRLVTNFESACDRDYSLTLDFFLDERDSLDMGMTEESIWNYHVWNEAWMKREDLENELYDGWQVVDATPMILSDGLYRTGPCPVEAIKQGNVHIPYDAEFIFGEVNADVVYWIRGNDLRPSIPLKVNTRKVGHRISTKAIGSDTRKDITDRYKYPEGSHQERQVKQAAMKRNCSRFGNSGLAKNLLCEVDVENETVLVSRDIDLQLRCDNELVFGTTFKMELIITSLIDSIDVTGKLVLKISDYTGRHTETIKKIPFYVRLVMDHSKSIGVRLDFDEYFRPNPDLTCIKVTCTARVKGYDRTYFAMDSFHLASPTIRLSLVENSEASRLAVQIEFTNPLRVPLTDGFLFVEGSRFTAPFEKQCDLIPVGETAQFFYPINVSQRGKAVISVRFVSNELKIVDGHIVVKIP